MCHQRLLGRRGVRLPHCQSHKEAPQPEDQKHQTPVPVLGPLLQPLGDPEPSRAAPPPPSLGDSEGPWAHTQVPQGPCAQAEPSASSTPLPLSRPQPVRTPTLNRRGQAAVESDGEGEQLDKGGGGHRGPRRAEAAARPPGGPGVGDADGPQYPGRALDRLGAAGGHGNTACSRAGLPSSGFLEPPAPRALHPQGWRQARCQQPEGAICPRSAQILLLGQQRKWGVPGNAPATQPCPQDKAPKPQRREQTDGRTPPDPGRERPADTAPGWSPAAWTPGPVPGPGQGRLCPRRAPEQDMTSACSFLPSAWGCQGQGSPETPADLAGSRERRVFSRLG